MVSAEQAATGTEASAAAIAPPDSGHRAAAPRAKLSGLFDQLESALDTVNFWRVPEKKEGMWRNIRAVFLRAAMTAQEVATWRGILRVLKDGR